MIALVAVASGCDLDTTPVETEVPSSTASATRTTPPRPPTPARRLLAQLRVEERPPEVASDYRRDAFGSDWRDIDGNGCDQRDDVLLRDVDTSQPYRTASYGRCDHDLLAGTWLDPYTGRTLTFDDLKDLRQAQAIQIDHVVPLSEGWRSGARDWTEERRVRFANTLANLLAVDGPTNASKGDDDPAAWRPRKAYQCSYARRWIRVKHRWDLAADLSEKRALTEMLDHCARS